eukprot:530382_1
MKRFNLDETSVNLKIKLKISEFNGESSFAPNTDISAGTCIPVLIKNNNNDIYLHTMKWGIDILNTGKTLASIAGIEEIYKIPWSPLINSNQKCIIVCNGFYLQNKQSFYIEPNKLKEGVFLYILGLYKETHSQKGRSLSCVAISQSGSNDRQYFGYDGHIPLFCRNNQINKWLFSKAGFNAYQFTKNNILVTPCLEIGNNEFNFDEIEKKALEPNELNKYNNNNNNNNNN